MGGVILSFGLIGAADDYAKLTKRSHEGISGRVRLLCGIGGRFFGCGGLYQFYND